MTLVSTLRALTGRTPLASVRWLAPSWVPAGMSLDEARRAGLVPPADWTPPPRDRLRDLGRTVRVVGGLLAEMYADGRGRPSGDTTTRDGLARVQARCAASARALGVEVRVHGTGRVPATGGLVFMWNQTSHLDHLVLPLAIPRPFHLTYNNEVRRFPIYGAYLAKSDHFWIDRTDETHWRAQLAAAADRIRDGACVLVSPEGTRSWDGRLLPMKRGAFMLARLAGRPIVCICVRGARELLPRGRIAIRPGVVDIELAEPIPVDESTSPHLEARVTATFALRA